MVSPRHRVQQARGSFLRGLLLWESLPGELLFPVRSCACLLAMLSFALLIFLALKAGLPGLWLLAVVVTALFGFLVIVAEARAQGRDVEPPGIEFFTLGGRSWTVFPVVPAAGTLLVVRVLADTQPAFAAAAILAACAVLPAMIAVIVITHSPLQSLNPAALIRLVRAVGPSYLLASILFLMVGAAVAAGGAAGLLAGLYLLFAFHAVCGTLLREHDLLHEIEIPGDETVAAALTAATLAQARRDSLGHAYALFSRGNEKGALDYLAKWLDEDPEPYGARAWFLNEMSGWENRRPALCFGQDYLGWLLVSGETIPAVKLMLRLRLLDPAFRPAAADLPAALAAARASGNTELAVGLGGAFS
jgi:hypothetical protein